MYICIILSCRNTTLCGLDIKMKSKLLSIFFSDTIYFACEIKYFIVYINLINLYTVPQSVLKKEKKYIYIIYIDRYRKKN